MALALILHFYLCDPLWAFETWADLPWYLLSTSAWLTVALLLALTGGNA